MGAAQEGTSGSGRCSSVKIAPADDAPFLFVSDIGRFGVVFEWRAG